MSYKQNRAVWARSFRLAASLIWVTAVLGAQEAHPSSLVGKWMQPTGEDLPGDPADTAFITFASSGIVYGHLVKVMPDLDGPIVERTKEHPAGRWKVQWRGQEPTLCVKWTYPERLKCGTYTVSDNILEWREWLMRRR